jgi:hypothetical protein
MAKSGQELVETFHDAAQDAGRLAVHALGEVPYKAFGHHGIAKLPSFAHAGDVLQFRYSARQKFPVGRDDGSTGFVGSTSDQCHQPRRAAGHILDFGQPDQQRRARGRHVVEIGNILQAPAELGNSQGIASRRAVGQKPLNARDRRYFGAARRQASA